MPFVNNDFPGQVFNTVNELTEAIAKRKQVEEELDVRSDDEVVTHVTATIIPTAQSELERRVILLEQQLDDLRGQLQENKKSLLNKDNLPVGMVLKGISKGQDYTLEILEEGYLCSTGEIAATLSAAAEEVSGNRRSGWAFWTDVKGTPIGEITGRFNKRELTDPFGALTVS